VIITKAFNLAIVLAGWQKQKQIVVCIAYSAFVRIRKMVAT